MPKRAEILSNLPFSMAAQQKIGKRHFAHKTTAKSVVIALMLAAFSAPSATAQTATIAPTTAPTTADRPSALAPLFACAAISDNVARLACYDGVAHSLEQSEASGDVVAIDRAQVEQVRREAFGFHLPSLPSLRLPTRNASAPRAQPEEELGPQNFTIVRVGRFDGKQAITTDSGQIWVLLDPSALSPPQRTPFNVRIRPASLGSFLMQVEGLNRGYRVRRVQ